MEQWQKILQKSIEKIEELPSHLRPDNEDTGKLAEVVARYPMRINPYYLNLIKKKNDPIWKQAVPDILEIQDVVCTEDPLEEEHLSPVPNLVHKYRDRVLLLISSQCGMYCRFCTRKRKVGKPMPLTEANFNAACTYLRNHSEIQEVLISGGDPLLLGDTKLQHILHQLHTIRNIKILRIGTRVPCTLPMRITPTLLEILKKFHPIYINTQFNHPLEITPEATAACTALADAGIPLGCQTVLLKGINDEPEIIEELMRKLLTIRVRPYYLFQGDLTKGTDHFRTQVEKGIDIMRHLYKNLSGMAIPIFALDAPDGSGKIPLTPQYISSISSEELRFINIQGNECRYPNPNP